MRHLRGGPYLKLNASHMNLALKRRYYVAMTDESIPVKLIVFSHRNADIQFPDPK